MNEIDQAIAAVRQTQGVVLVQLATFLRSPSREAAARLDDAIDADRSAIDLIAGHRVEYFAPKQGAAR
jgi:xanthine/CO dehydrogenase XdhC/CoxF family maturation factor